MEKWRLSLAGLLATALLTGCGIGGTDEEAVRKKNEAANQPTEAGAPTLTNNNATDGFNWINYRRKQVGVAVLARNSQIDTAAQGHSDYQRVNNTITHEQTAGTTGYTGARLTDRLTAAGYNLTGTSYAAGEVISATTNTTGFYQSEELITAIYHRYVMFDPAFRDMGVGSATVSGGYTYFTADFGVTGSYNSLGRGQLVTYPVNSQTGVPVNFYSDTEAPDPVPNQNLVGYPISVHADTYGSTSGTVVVQSFTVTPRGGAALSTRLLSYEAGNNNNVTSAASIIPLAPLAASTTYDVSFSGTVGGVAVTRNWSFTTK